MKEFRIGRLTTQTYLVVDGQRIPDRVVSDWCIGCFREMQQETENGSTHKCKATVFDVVTRKQEL